MSNVGLPWRCDAVLVALQASKSLRGRLGCASPVQVSPSPKKTSKSTIQAYANICSRQEAAKYKSSLEFARLFCDTCLYINLRQIRFFLGLDQSEHQFTHLEPSRPISAHQRHPSTFLQREGQNSSGHHHFAKGIDRAEYFTVRIYRHFLFISQERVRNLFSINHLTNNHDNSRQRGVTK